MNNFENQNNINQEIKNIIKKNLPEKRELKECEKCNACEMMMSCEVLYADRQFNQAISQINTSLIADEVLKVIIRKIEEIETFEPEDDFVDGGDMEYASRRLAVDNSRRWGEIKIKTDILHLLSNLSPKENKNND